MKPGNLAELVEQIKAGKRFEIVGQGSKSGIGHPIRDAELLETSGLSGIISYDPEELVLTALAGTPMSEIEKTLAAAGQALPFEPPDFAPLFGQPQGAGTLGGLVATGLSGPRRLTAGAMRDHLLGVTIVTGDGQIVKAGGKVVKNVTGFDLSRLMAGAYGTLGVLGEITLKTGPKPESEKSLLLAAPPEALSQAMTGPFEISAAAYLPPCLVPLSRVSALRGAGLALCVFRLEGPEPSVLARMIELKAALANLGPLSELEKPVSQAVWAEIRNLSWFAERQERQIWRISTSPTRGPALGARLASELDALWLADWAGGEIWLAMPPQPDAGQALIRSELAEAGGGHTTLIRAEIEVRNKVPVFQPAEPALSMLSRRLKTVFDPSDKLNPGRMSLA
jgi:glycolate oxidase FAD binding subunit